MEEMDDIWLGSHQERPKVLGEKETPVFCLQKIGLFPERHALMFEPFHLQTLVYIGIKSFPISHGLGSREAGKNRDFMAQPLQLLGGFKRQHLGAGKIFRDKLVGCQQNLQWSKTP